MKVKITRRGNSLGIRLPVFAAQNLGLSAGDGVEVSLENGHILITPLKPALRDLVKSIPPAVQGGEIGETMSGKKSSGDRSAAPNRGDEIWLDFSPVAGHEQSGPRPALVISPRIFANAGG